MTIDNFELFRKHLTFVSNRDRYIVHILCRPKDISDKERQLIGSNEKQRLIKTYYIDSLEYFDRKTEAIKEMCRQNNARAYILPQVRDTKTCIAALGCKVMEIIAKESYNVRPDHILRSAYCECHTSRDKKWILDLDADCMDEYIYEMGFPRSHISSRRWTVEEVLKLVQDNLEKCGKSRDDAYIVKTKSGHHIVTSPFNLKEAFEKCGMMYEGVKKVVVTNEGDRKDIVGWLHKDGMSVLFMETKKQ